MTASTRHFRFLGCEILYREACHLSAVGPHRVDVEFLQKGLHDLQTSDMVAKIQSRIDAIDSEADDSEAILLGYARCNDGLTGIHAGRLPLVIPRAHDCITLFFGSRKAYQDYFDNHPGTYFNTTGWIERNNSAEGQIERPAYGMEGVMAKLGLTESYEQLVEKHGKENADYIIETMGGWQNAYSRLCYIEMGVCDETPLMTAARHRAAEHGWAFDHRKGDWTLLEKLFFGHWDSDFVIVQPGERIVSRNDGRILDAERGE